MCLGHVLKKVKTGFQRNSVDFIALRNHGSISFPKRRAISSHFKIAFCEDSVNL